jgi:hypothetical protein
MVRIQKESEQASLTHFLKSIDRLQVSYIERIQANKGHSQTEEHRQIDKSEHRKNRSNLGTYRLSTDGQTSQHIERIQAGEGHSQTEGHRWTDKLGHGNII